MLAVFISLGTAYAHVRAVTTVARVVAEATGRPAPGLMSLIPVTAYLLVLLAIGLWFEKSWARSGLRAYTTVSLVAMLVTQYWIWRAIDKPPALRPVVSESLPFLVAWFIRFEGEYPTVMSLRERLGVSLISCWGRLILITHVLRRWFGRSYYSWTYDSYAIGLGGSMTRGQEMATIGTPDLFEGSRYELATLRVDSGRVVICDPSFLTHEFDGRDIDVGVVIDGVEPGDYSVQLQIVRLPRADGRVILRARLTDVRYSVDSLNIAGEAMVDLARLCFGDAQRVSEHLAAAGEDFEPINDWLDCEDPVFTIHSPEDGEPLVTIFDSGFGDGVYPVYVTPRGKRVCTITVDMGEFFPEQKVSFLRRRPRKTS